MGDEVKSQPRKSYGMRVDRIIEITVFVVELVILTSLTQIACVTLVGAADRPCPPFYQCTPSGSWNNSDCKCWNKEIKAARRSTLKAMSSPPSQN